MPQPHALRPTRSWPTLSWPTRSWPTLSWPRLGGLALLGLGCEPPPVSSPPESAPPAVYRLSPSGDALLTPEGAEPLRFEGGRVVSPTRSVKLRRRWDRLGSVLGPCLGDPLALPPAADPEATRKLVWASPEPYWRIELSGLNRCGLEGRLELELRRDVVRGVALSVDGLGWAEGGQDRAQQTLRAELISEAAPQWPSLGLKERILVLKRLSESDDPGAEEALKQIIALDDENRLEAEAALARSAARRAARMAPAEP